MAKPVVLITGALTGIGRATAVAFANQGARLVVSGRREAEGASLEAELRARDIEARFVRADVRREDDVRSLIDRAVELFGRIDVAVNNAGVEGTPDPITNITEEGFTEVFGTNVLGVLLGMKHELRVMQGQRSGSIVNISSTMGSRGAANMSLYTGSKHAVEGVTKSAALEAAAFGVRVNAVAPGPTDTGMLGRLTERVTGSADNKATWYANIPLKRGGAPEEIADAIVFLSSDKASFITGQILMVNGGKTAS
jgi:NAD(P)-dependent dehydrogenase (short-subunit alcohol dehydrogenase family)